MATGLALGLIAVLLATAVLAVPLARRPLATPLIYGLALPPPPRCSASRSPAFSASPPPLRSSCPSACPGSAPISGIDSLSAFFLAVVDLGAAAASLYALGYGRHEEAPWRVLPFFPAFIAAMNLVVMADDAFAFLLSWEAMSLASWALVIAHHREAGNVRAGYIYIVMASAGTLALLLAFGLLAGPTGSYAFDAMRAAHLSPAFAALVLALVLFGAGSKAGIVPLHVWLPLAHPAAPSHVSALMSGVMTKVAIYGFIRIAFDLAGTPQYWWSIPVLTLGGISAVMGLLYAMLEDDLKRLLAYSTVENVGVIFIGLGLSLAFKVNGMGEAAALAMTAALFHVLNHSIFKSLLFFGAGSVLDATGERRIEQDGRAHPRHAGDRLRLSCRRHGDLGPAAAQRLRLRMADLPGDPPHAPTCRNGA